MSSEPVFARRQKSLDREEEKRPEVTSEPKAKVAERMPVPTGYRILIALPQADETTDGGIVKVAETKRVEEVSSICGMVIAMGPDCYKDAKRFPSGAYCEIGQWVLMRSYSGTRFGIDGTEVRLINDDSVEAVVDDPRGITKL
jgi:co-chaperonin GroES (HSP10)